MKRGQIWWADLPNPTGSAPGYRRPVVIVQADNFNKSQINTVIAVPITSNLRLAEMPGNVALSIKASGLKRESVANVTQLVAFDRKLLNDLIGAVDYHAMVQIDEGLRLVLSL